MTTRDKAGTLDALPSNGDVFWNEAETERVTLKPDVVCQKGGHVFLSRSATEVKCQKCPVGYILTPGSEIRDGHIYLENQLLF